ncbi:hypothetical protein CLV32_0232 [Pedobacter duraquae]|uniref:Uncharacterized protein n=2 Tax=Pedobacter duraquae TaxID=425511 RepID=A0A4R6IPL5_9SPHI|nr:hypothetical protein CLV32_0232 [Pedobacter duraquae]
MVIFDSMNKDKELSAVIHSTSGGRLYIEAQDFFGQDKIKNMVSKLMESSIFKQIEREKNKK